MKKILWFAIALIFFIALFLKFGFKHDEHANSGHQNHQVSTEKNHQLTGENLVDLKPLQLSAFASLQNAWVTAPPPGSSVAAVYMVIANSGETAAKLVSVESDDFDEMMFHRTVIEDGVASMRHLEFLEVPSSGSLTLEPNGLHIMAIEPERELKAGDQVSISFTFDNGETYSADVPVR